MSGVRLNLIVGAFSQDILEGFSFLLRAWVLAKASCSDSTGA